MGVLFIVATVANVVGGLAFTEPILENADYLVKVTESQNGVLVGALLLIASAFASAGIAIFLYPILRKHDEGLALGSVGFRIIEGVSYLAAAVCVLSILSLGQEYVTRGMVNTPYFQTLGNLLLAVRDWTGNIVGVMSFCIGALSYYVVFYRSRLIPRWLSLWGIVGIILLFPSVLLVMFSLISALGAIQAIMALPIAVQEMVLAVWLIVKGFNPSAIASYSAKTDINKEVK